MNTKNQPIIDICAVNPAFADLDGVIPLLHGIPEADWRAEDFGKIKIWSEVAIDETQQLALGEDWFEGVINGGISAITVINGLKLAMSMRSMKPGSANFLISQQVRDRVGSDSILAAVSVPSFTLRAQQMVGGPAQALANVVPFNIPAGDDSNPQKAKAYCFLAAYMMKLIVKSPKNVVQGLANMKQRYKSLYGPSRTVAGFSINISQATTYRDVLQSQPLVQLTYTHALAYTEQNTLNNLDPKEVSLLNYLGFLPFSYTGMHAYTLMMEIMNFTKIPFDKLLPLFRLNITSSALVKIGTIYRDYERTSAAPNRDISFRYCTLWGTQYFTSVRSKKCAHLVYMVACAWKTLAPGHQNADPERIVAVNSLSESMKNSLKIIGQKTGESLKRIMAGSAGVSNPLSPLSCPLIASDPQQEDDNDEYPSC